MRFVPERRNPRGTSSKRSYNTNLSKKSPAVQDMKFQSLLYVVGKSKYLVNATDVTHQVKPNRESVCFKLQASSLAVMQDAGHVPRGSEVLSPIFPAHETFKSLLCRRLATHGHGTTRHLLITKLYPSVDPVHVCLQRKL
jgi:hypothetical protein